MRQIVQCLSFFLVKAQQHLSLLVYVRTERTAPDSFIAAICFENVLGENVTRRRKIELDVGAGNVRSAHVPCLYFRAFQFNFLPSFFVLLGIIVPAFIGALHFAVE